MFVTQHRTELNLMPNLPAPWCGPTPTTGTEPCFNTSMMVRYEESLVAAIRRNDPTRPISSGHSMPRATAWHQEHCAGDAKPPPAGCDGGYGSCLLLMLMLYTTRTCKSKLLNVCNRPRAYDASCTEYCAVQSHALPFCVFLG